MTYIPDHAGCENGEYGLIIGDEGMYPAFRQGDVVLFDRNQKPSVNEPALFTLTSGQVFLLLVVGQSSAGYICRNIYETTVLWRIDHFDIRSAHGWSATIPASRAQHYSERMRISIFINGEVIDAVPSLAA